jgi:hypothetical protein
VFPLPSSSQLGHKRPYTDWRDGGACQLPDYAWNDWGNSQTERVLDLIDIDYLREAALYSIDAKLKTKVWDLSRRTSTATPRARGCASRTPRTRASSCASMLAVARSPLLAARSAPLTASASASALSSSSSSSSSPPPLLASARRRASARA